MTVSWNCSNFVAYLSFKPHVQQYKTVVDEVM